jgi:hypothetical protein
LNLNRTKQTVAAGAGRGKGAGKARAKAKVWTLGQQFKLQLGSLVRAFNVRSQSLNLAHKKITSATGLLRTSRAL